MQFGSIHRDERSARRAAQALIRAGIEPARVRIVRPRVSRPPDPTPPAPAAEWKRRLLDVATGAGFGAACGILACAALAIARAHYLVLDPLGAMLAIVVSAAITGAFVALFMRARANDVPVAAAAAPRVRSRTRGWAVVVDARDAEQRALAALALSRTA